MRPSLAPHVVVLEPLQCNNGVARHILRRILVVLKRACGNFESFDCLATTRAPRLAGLVMHLTFQAFRFGRTDG